MSDASVEVSVPPCLRNVPGHHPSLAQIADAGRHAHRIVEAIDVEGEHTLSMTLDDGERVVARCHVTGEIAEVWAHRVGVTTWNPAALLLAVPLSEPVWGTAYYFLAVGAYTPCDELARSAEADVAAGLGLDGGFDGIVDGALGDLRAVRARAAPATSSPPVTRSPSSRSPRPGGTRTVSSSGSRSSMTTRSCSRSPVGSWEGRSSGCSVGSVPEVRSGRSTGSG